MYGGCEDLKQFGDGPVGMPPVGHLGLPLEEAFKEGTPEHVSVTDRARELICDRDDDEERHSSYLDPILERDEKLYHESVDRLLDSGIVSLQSSAEDGVTFFSVSKADGSLRLGFDCRASN